MFQKINPTVEIQTQIRLGTIQRTSTLWRCFRYLEPGPQGEVDPVQVVIQAGDAPLVHNQLVVVVDADHHQQTQNVPRLLHTPHIVSHALGKLCRSWHSDKLCPWYDCSVMKAMIDWSASKMHT